MRRISFIAYFVCGYALVILLGTVIARSRAKAAGLQVRPLIVSWAMLLTRPDQILKVFTTPGYIPE